MGCASSRTSVHIAQHSSSSGSERSRRSRERGSPVVPLEIVVGPAAGRSDSLDRRAPPEVRRSWNELSTIPYDSANRVRQHSGRSVQRPSTSLLSSEGMSTSAMSNTSSNAHTVSPLIADPETASSGAGFHLHATFVQRTPSVKSTSSSASSATGPYPALRAFLHHHHGHSNASSDCTNGDADQASRPARDNILTPPGTKNIVLSRSPLNSQSLPVDTAISDFEVVAAASAIDAARIVTKSASLGRSQRRPRSAPGSRPHLYPTVTSPMTPTPSIDE